MSSPPTAGHRRFSREHRKQYAELATRIRRYTTTIWHTHLQPPALYPDISKKKPHRHWTRVYEDLATLLNVGSTGGRTIAVTGGPMIGPRHTISVVVTQRASQWAAETGSVFDDPISDSAPRLRVERIDPSATSLVTLANDMKRVSNLSIHAADVLQGVKLITSSKNIAEDHILLSIFIFRRCWTEIKFRIEASRYLLYYPPSECLVTVLRDWELDPEDPITDQGTWERVNSGRLRQVLSAEGIPMMSAPDGAYFRLSTGTVKIWFKVLLSTLENVFSAAQDYESSKRTNHLERLVHNMIILFALLECDAILKIFDFQSLENHLMNYQKQPSGMGHLNTYGPDPVEPQRLAECMGDERRGRERATQHVLRYMGSLLIWCRASLSLSGWVLRFGPQMPLIHMVYVCKPAFPAPDPSTLRALARRTAAPERMALHRLTLDFPWTEEEQDIFKEIVDDLCRPGSIDPLSTGAPQTQEDEGLSIIHPEALAMGLMKDAMHSEATESFPLTWALTNSNRLIGVPAPGHCCYCCHFLHGALFQTSAYRERRRPADVDTWPGFTHPGLVVPWAPPPIGYGVTLEALEILEDELQGLLVVVLRDYLKPTFAQFANPAYLAASVPSHTNHSPLDESLGGDVAAMFYQESGET